MLERAGGIEPAMSGLEGHGLTIRPSPHVLLVDCQGVEPRCPGRPQIYSLLRSPMPPAILTFKAAAVAPPGIPQKQQQS